MMARDGLSSVGAGITAVALGIVLTSISYVLATPGGTYILFVGLIFGGLVSIVRGLVTPSAPSGTLHSLKGPAQSLVSGYVALPEEMPPGYCWQCGRKVKADRVICWGCGATQLRGAASRYSSDSGSQNEEDLNASASADAIRWESSPPPRKPAPAKQWRGPMYQPGAPPPRKPAPAKQWRGPMYQPGAPSPWDVGDARERPPDPPARPRRS
jgi:hypothetical protein